MNPRLSLVLIAVMLLSGCAAQDRATMLTRSVQAEEIYTTSLERLVEARRAGRITDNAAIEIEKWRKIAAAAIDTAQAAALAEDPTAFGSAMVAVTEAMGHLLAERVRASKPLGPVPLNP